MVEMLDLVLYPIPEGGMDGGAQSGTSDRRDWDFPDSLSLNLKEVLMFFLLDYSFSLFHLFLDDYDKSII